MNKETILEVQDYFKQKLIRGEFEITKITEFETSVLIDKDFQFVIWTSNGEWALKISEHATSFIDISELTKAEKEKMWKHFEKPVEKFKGGDLLEQKRKQFEKLRKELNIPA